MAEKLFEGQQLDAVTQKIVDEVAAESAKKEESLPPAEESKESEAKETEEKSEVSKESEPETELKIVLDDEDEEEEAEDDKPARSGKYVPLKKWQSEKRKRQEVEAKLQELLSSSKDVSKSEESKDVLPDVSDFAKSLETEFEGVNAKVIEKILAKAVTLASQKSKLPDEVVRQIQEFQKTKEEQDSNQVFDREFSEISKHPEYASVDKKKLYELAHTDGKIEIDGVKYPIKTVPLRVLIEVAGLKSTKKKTAEVSRGGSRATEVKDYKNMSLEELAQLPPKEFLEASNQLEKKKSIF